MFNITKIVIQPPYHIIKKINLLSLRIDDFLVIKSLNLLSSDVGS